MELRQRLELRRLLAPELRQSLKILALPILDLRELVDQELVENPLLEETGQDSPLSSSQQIKAESLDADLPPSDFASEYPLSANETGQKNSKSDFIQGMLTKKITLQDVLLRQLGMFATTQEEACIGQEIIGNIDGNGYFKGSLEEIAQACHSSLEQTEAILKLIQQFEPAGVAARDISECLLIQLKLLNQNDPVLEQIIRFHLDDVAKKNHTRIAKSLKLPLEQIEPLIEKIAKLDPKPGRNYSADETQQVIPDVIIEETEEGLKISINNEDIPHVIINRSYREMLKQKDLDPKAKEFLTEKLRRAYELLRSLSRRQSTLRKVINTLIDIQKEAITQDVSYLKPLTFREVAEKIQVHESTVCRVVMNKYAQTPQGVIALKDFFPSKLKQADANGESVSSEQIKALIRDYISEEDKRHPLSDEDIVKALKEKNSLNVARRTVAKYREELKILSSSYRRLR